MNINIYQECRTAAEKLEALETALGELRRAWDVAQSSLDRYAVSDMAGRVVRWAQRTRVPTDPSVDVTQAVAAIQAATRWHQDWVWATASPAGKQAINQTADEWRLSRR